MESFRRNVFNWSGLLPFVKGRKSHQFTTDTLGANIYFNSAGMPVYAADDSPFTTFESHITETWYHRYYYNKTETSPMIAIENFRDGAASIYIEEINNGRTVNFKEYWLWDTVRPADKRGFSISELILPVRYKWYTVTDAIS